MSLEIFYDTVGGDLSGVRGRLMTDERIEKFVGIFFQDPTFNTLVESYGNQDWETAFRAAHTMKGTCADLGFMPLSAAASELTETLRPDDDGTPHDLPASEALYQQVVDGYEQLVEAKALL